MLTYYVLPARKVPRPLKTPNLTTLTNQSAKLLFMKAQFVKLFVR